MADMKNTTVAMDLQGKLELYFVGLVFTLLGASIQTAKFGGRCSCRRFANFPLGVCSWFVGL